MLRKKRWSVAAGTALTAAMCIMTPSDAGSPGNTGGGVIVVPLCQLIPNGAFQNGFTNWTVTPFTSGYGLHWEYTNAGIYDMSGNGGDTTMACLSVGSSAEWWATNPSGSSATAQIELSTTTVATARYLQYFSLGSWEFLAYAKPRICLDALIRVSTADGRSVTCSVSDNCYDLGMDCSSGISVLGTFGTASRCCDLAAGGIAVGETVTITVLLSCAVTASRECDWGEFGGTWCVDKFQFCNACLVTAEPEPIEITRPVTDDEPEGVRRADGSGLKERVEKTRENAGAADLESMVFGDLNADRRITADDLVILAQLVAAKAEGPVEADVNRDGVIDDADLNEVARNCE